MKVGIYIDCASLFHGALHYDDGTGNCKPRVDYMKLVEKMRAGREVAEARAYIISRAGVSFDGFKGMLERLGLEVEVIPEAESRNARLEVVTDALHPESQWDVLAVATDDNFHHSTLAELAVRGEPVELYHFGERPNNKNIKSIRLGREVVAIRDRK